MAGAGDGGVEQFAGVHGGFGWAGHEVHFVVFRALGAVYGEGEEGLVGGQSCRGEQHGVAVWLAQVREPHGFRVCAAYHHAGVAVGEAGLPVVAGDDEGAAKVELLVAFDGEQLAQPAFHQAIEAVRAERAAAVGAEHAQVGEGLAGRWLGGGAQGLDHGCASRPCVAFGNAVEGFGAGQWAKRGLFVVLVGERSLGAVDVAGHDSRGQAAYAAAGIEPPTGREARGAVRERGFRRCPGGAQIAEHRSGLNGCQLRGVAEQDEARGVR